MIHITFSLLILRKNFSSASFLASAPSLVCIYTVFCNRDGLCTTKYLITQITQIIWQNCDKYLFSVSPPIRDRRFRVWSKPPGDAGSQDRGFCNRRTCQVKCVLVRTLWKTWYPTYDLSRQNTNWFRWEVPFFLGHGLRNINWELNHKKYIKINFNTYLECQSIVQMFMRFFTFENFLDT